MACVVKGCTETTRKKALMCSKHWYAIPAAVRDDARKGTEKGTQTLRVQPSREWLSLVSKYVGDLKHLAVRADASGKVNRSFQAKPEPTAAV